MTATTALIGCGNWGQNLIRHFAQLDVLHSLCDVDTSLLAALSRRYPNAHTITNYRDILQNKDIDAVVIAGSQLTVF